MNTIISHIKQAKKNSYLPNTLFFFFYTQKQEKLEHIAQRKKNELK